MLLFNVYLQIHFSSLSRSIVKQIVIIPNFESSGEENQLNDAFSEEIRSETMEKSRGKKFCCSRDTPTQTNT